MYPKMNLKTRRTEIKKLYIMHHSKRKKNSPIIITLL